MKQTVNAGHTLDKDGLTKNQRVFVNEYLKDRNGTRAYLCAFKTCKNLNSAGQSASRLLKNARVIKAIERELQQAHEEAKIEAVDIRRELARIGFSDIRSLFTVDGRLKKPHEWTDDVSAAISAVDVVTRTRDGEIEYVHKIRTWDKKGSLELLGKELAMFTEKPKEVDKSKIAPVQVIFNTIDASKKNKLDE